MAHISGNPARRNAFPNRGLLLIVLLAAPLFVLGYLVVRQSIATSPGPSGPEVADETVIAEPLGVTDMASVATIVSELWHGTEPELLGDLPARFRRPAQPIFVAARTKGYLATQFWHEGRGSTVRELDTALSRAKRELGAAKADAIDTLQIDFTHSFREVDASRLLQRNYTRSQRAQQGIEIRRRNDLMRYSPTRMITTNRGLRRIQEVFRDRFQASDEDLESAAVKYRTFEADAILVRLGTAPRAHFLERGNEVVHVREVTRAAMANWVELAAGYLREHVHQDGRMTYKYWPSTLKEPPSSVNNEIRQWMATVALGRFAADRNDQAMWDLAERNIDYNLDKFYRREGDLGMIEWNGQVKLGALAVATIALIEHPKRQKWAQHEAALRRSIESLWHEDGSFATFLKPEGRNDNVNFYPGEALLLWALLYERDRDELLLDRFMKSFRYYRAWHMDPENRNPAFIPWHTQACFAVWTLTKNQELRNFVFEMSDWLLAVQQWDNATSDDERGHFYDPTRPFGPSHASSTGVYIEGLIDAYRMAKEVKDTQRSEAYRVSLVRAMRSMLQLQFADDVDMFYVPEDKRRFVKGGLRTTVYVNEIRCDNVQHPLIGILKVLRLFESDDYKHPA